MNGDKLRILHVAFHLKRGGMETCIMQFLRAMDRRRYAVDIALHTSSPGDYDAEARQLGCRLLRNERPAHPLGHRRHFRQMLRQCGPYDVVHVHDMVYGPLLGVARRAGVPVRILHSHNDVRRTMPQSRFMRLYYYWGRRVGCRSMTDGLGVSDVAVESMFGAGWRRDRRVQVLLSGRDFQAFRQPGARQAVRAELGFGETARVVGHVGRFCKQKNHEFLLKVFCEVAAKEPAARLLLVGDGPLHDTVRERVRAMGLEERVVFAGLQTDVPRLLQAMDVFVFPSLFEGLPGALVEAQAAGLACFCSDAITASASMVPELVMWRSLRAPVAEWAGSILDQLQRPPILAPGEALKRAESSAFGMAQHLTRLGAIYASASISR